MVAIEAMASGTPVLALRRGGMTEYMRDGENAQLVTPGLSSREFAAAIETAFSDPARLASISVRARELVTGQFTWEHVTARTEQTYAEALRDTRVVRCG